MNNLLAQSQINIGQISGLGPLGVNPSDAPNKFNQILTLLIGILTLIAGVWFFFLLITGGIAWMAAGGDQRKLSEARSRITTGLIGLVIVVAAIFIIQIIGNLLGFGDILNPASYIDLLVP